MSVTNVVKPGVLNSSFVWALISVTGVSDPSDDDWLGLYALNDDETTINVTTRAPVKFQVYHFQYILIYAYCFKNEFFKHLNNLTLMKLI